MLRALLRHAGPDELMVTTTIHDPAERRHSDELLAGAVALTAPGRAPGPV